MKKHQTLVPEAALPGIDERLAQAEAANRRLAEHGFIAVGLDHFARADDTLSLALSKGTLHRNFQGYTTDSAPALIAFGASGIGALPQGYVCNDTEIHAWKRTVNDGFLPIKRGIAISDEDRLRREVIERLMCDLVLDVGALAVAHGRPVNHFDRELSGFGEMIADDLMTLEDRTITITDEGRPLVRAVAAKFDQYLKAGEQRHSKAV
jgi:oxygen-independent coproporphyrinogen-3 oxidase